MPLPILVVQQVAHEPAALIGETLAAYHRKMVTIVVDHDAIPSDADNYCAVIIMGGPASANDDNTAIHQQLRLIQWCLTHNTPLLGICLGAQLIAKAAGGVILPAAVRELGWYPLHPTADSESDALFHGFTQPQPVFQWHGETFTLPDHATLLAQCSQVPNQAFRLNNAQYGLQFHVEIDDALVDCWIDHGADERSHLGPTGIKKIQQDTPHHVDTANRFCDRLITRWLALL